jgi:hypothetical protein
MKVISVVVVIIPLLDTYLYWPMKDARDVVASAFLASWGVVVFFLGDSKIDADERGVRIIAPYGIYALDWSEVKAVEVNRFSTGFYGEKKLVRYTLLLVGKGKCDLKAFVADMIQRHQIQRGRPPGIKNSQMAQMRRNAKIRGWKLF